MIYGQRSNREKKKGEKCHFPYYSQEKMRGKVEGNERIFSARENDEKSSVIHSRIFFRRFQFIRWKGRRK